MRIKTLQWNIGGGKIRSKHADPADTAAYRDDGLEEIKDLIRRASPDVITLQETHAEGDRCQAEEIAIDLGYGYWINDVTDESFIEPGMQIGQSIISRYPLSGRRFTPIPNPDFQTASPDGIVLHSKNCGVTSCTLYIPGQQPIRIATVHVTPFHFFGVETNSPAAASMLHNLESGLLELPNPKIVQGDFNLDSASLRSHLPGVFSTGIREINQSAPTTPKGKRLDHVLYAGPTVAGSRVDTKVLTDHYPIISEFELCPPISDRSIDDQN